MPTLESRAPDSESSITLANVVLVAALLAIAYAVYVTYAGFNADTQRSGTK